eukprot:2621874-Amphidinium_carterae.1
MTSSSDAQLPGAERSCEVVDGLNLSVATLSPRTTAHSLCHSAPQWRNATSAASSSHTCCPSGDPSG